MNLEKVLKVMAAITALLVACSEVLNQANLYKNSVNNTTVDNTATDNKDKSLTA